MQEHDFPKGSPGARNYSEACNEKVFICNFLSVLEIAPSPQTLPGESSN